MVIKSYGYQVIDLGKNAEHDELVMAAIDNQADFIGVSSLITTAISYVREVKRIAADKGLHNVKIFAGGAAIKQSNAEFVNVDFVSDTAFDGLHYINNL